MTCLSTLGPPSASTVTAHTHRSTRSQQRAAFIVTNLRPAALHLLLPLHRRHRHLDPFQVMEALMRVTDALKSIRVRPSRLEPRRMRNQIPSFSLVRRRKHV